MCNKDRLCKTCQIVKGLAKTQLEYHKLRDEQPNLKFFESKE